jgi:hypothetical protein
VHGLKKSQSVQQNDLGIPHTDRTITGHSSENTLWWPKNVITNIFFEIMQLSTSTKSILKEVFINCTQNKVLQ